jgi:hypothetical protein
MKQISEVEEKPFTSSLYICSETFCRFYRFLQLIAGYFIPRRRNRYSPPRYFLHATDMDKTISVELILKAEKERKPFNLYLKHFVRRWTMHWIHKLRKSCWVKCSYLMGKCARLRSLVLFLTSSCNKMFACKPFLFRNDRDPLSN